MQQTFHPGKTFRLPKLICVTGTLAHSETTLAISLP
jgi:hypothetical protein